MTERSEAGEAVNTPETLSAMLHTFPVAAGLVTESGTWYAVSPPLEHLLSQQASTLLEARCEDLFEDGGSFWAADLQDIVSGLSPSGSVDIKLRPPHLPDKWLRVTLKPGPRVEGQTRLLWALFEDVSDYQRLICDLAENERRFRAVQDTTPDGYMIFDSVRDEAGKIIDFRWEFINSAAEAIIGRPAAELIGRHLLVEMPGNREEGLFEAYVRVVETGEPWQHEFHYRHEGLDAWFRSTSARAGDGFAVSFTDITAHVEGEMRLNGILNSVVAFIGLLTPDGRVVELNEPALRLSWLSKEQVLGRFIWEVGWWDHDDDLVAKVRDAVRQAAAGTLVRFDIEMQVAIGLIWIDFQIAPRLDDAGRVSELVPSAINITERKAAERQREFLMQELSHRVKNSLATVQAIAQHSLRDAQSLEQFRTSFAGRLAAIAQSHDFLFAEPVDAGELAVLIRRQIGAFVDPEGGRIRMRGPVVEVPAGAAHPLGLALHELSSNAAKHGAWSNSEGIVDLEWRVEPGPQIRIDWRELDGPLVRQPDRTGFGSVLLQKHLTYATGGDVDMAFEPTGFRAILRIPAYEEALA